VDVAANRGGRPHAAVAHPHGRPAVQHGELGLEDDVVDRPPPSRHAVAQFERVEVNEPLGSETAVAPLVRGELHHAVTHEEHWIEGRQAQHASAGGRRRHHQKTVIPPGGEAAERAHRIATEPVGHEPLARRRRIDVARDLPPEGDRAHDLTLAHRHRHADDARATARAVAGPAARASDDWRRWTGIEPAVVGSPRPPALKAGEPTRYPDTSAAEVTWSA